MAPEIIRFVDRGPRLNFNIKTLDDVPAGELQGHADLSAGTAEAGAQAACPRCGRVTWLWAMRDMRAMDGVAEDFLCDGCTSDMRRRHIPLNDEHDCKSAKDWDLEFARLNGAPSAVLNVIAAQNRHG